MKERSNTINGVVGQSPDELFISESVADELKWPVARLYCETYLSRNDKDRISDLIDEIISEYHGIIEEADFLTEETKAAAIEKLEAISKNVLWPDDWSKYGSEDLEIKSAAEGGSLWQAKKDIFRTDLNREIEKYLVTAPRLCRPVLCPQ